MTEQDTLRELLLQFNLRPREADAFIELVQMGARPISVWAKHMGIPRSSMYVVAEKLKTEGLVMEFERHGTALIKAVELEKIKFLLERRRSIIEVTIETLQRILPELQKLEHNLSITPKVTFYEGKERVMQAYDDVLKEASFRAFFNPTRVKNAMPEYHDKIPENLKKHRGSAKELVINCADGWAYQEKYNSHFHEIKLLPRGMTFDSDTIITVDRIYMIGYGTTDIVATEIHNAELAETQAVLFDLVWAGIE